MGQTAALEERAALAKQMNDILMQNYALIPLVHRGDVSAHANSLGGRPYELLGQRAMEHR